MKFKEREAITKAIRAFTAEAPNAAPNSDADRAIERLSALLDPNTWPGKSDEEVRMLAECNDAMADLCGDLCDKIKTLRIAAEEHFGGDFRSVPS